MEQKGEGGAVERTADGKASRGVRFDRRRRYFTTLFYDAILRRHFTTLIYDAF